MIVKRYPFKMVLWLDLMVEPVEVLNAISSELVEKEKKLPLFTMSSYSTGRRYIGLVEDCRFEFYRLYDYGFFGGYLKESKLQQGGGDSICFKGTILDGSKLRMEITIGKLNVFFIFVFTTLLIVDIWIRGLTTKNSIGLIIVFLFTIFLHVLLYREFAFWRTYLRSEGLTR